MKSLLVLFLLILISINTIAQDYYSDFKSVLNSGDTVKQLEILQNWENVSPSDPELYTCYFNYYFLKSKDEIIALSTKKLQGQGFELKDSLNNIAGYIGGETYFEENDFNKGIEKISEGIEKFPDRLDMRFGKIYAYGLVEDWNSFTTEIISAIKYSYVNKNKWTWTLDEKKTNGEDFFLASLQDYQVQLYNTGDDSLLINMRMIANEILRYYPNHIESLSNLSVTYLLLGEYDKGIEPLLMAEKIDPTDYIVLSNIAQGYKLKGDNDKAIEYYEKTIKYGDKQAIDFAKQQIEELKN
ncbi:MAG: hypothetical protein M0R23_09170 [Bacteroidales bacterium]|nr:hypothetical protein [Bacteroidales bacterium]